MKNTRIATLLAMIMCAGMNLALAQDKKKNDNKKVEAISAKAVKIVVDSLTRAIASTSAVPGMAEAVNGFLSTQLKSGAYSAIADRELLARTLSKDIAAASKDSLIIVLNAAAPAVPPKTVDLAAELPFERESNFNIREMKVFPGNIGFISISGFAHNTDKAAETLKAAFDFLVNTRALIINMHECQGTNKELASILASHFVDSKVELLTYTDAVGKKTTIVADPAKAGKIALKMPLYILTSRGTTGSAEEFAYSMQAIKRAVVVGSPSAGTAVEVRNIALPHGFAVQVPYRYPVSPVTKKNWQWSGVTPDLVVPGNQYMVAQQTMGIIFADLFTRAGYDTEKMLLNVKSEFERNIINFQLNLIKSKRNTNVLSEDLLNKYEGMYEGLRFFVKDGKLFCENTERRNAIFQLASVTESLFVLDENAQVEFHGEKAQGNQEIRMFWVDGVIKTKKLDKEKAEEKKTDEKKTGDPQTKTGER